MANPLYMPIENNFETTTRQQLDDDVAALTIYLNEVPTATLPVGYYFVGTLNPKTNLAEDVIIESINTTLRTVTVKAAGRAQAQGNGFAGTIHQHPVGSKFIISNSYLMYRDWIDAIASKASTSNQAFSGYIIVPVYANAAARDVGIPSPSNGMEVYLTTEGYFTDYVAGSWVQRASGTNPNASTTVAGRVEIATAAENTAGTDTGATGALLSTLPSVQAASKQKDEHNYALDTGSANALIVALTPAPAAYTTGMRISVKAAFASSGATTINVNGLGVKTIKKLHDQDIIFGDIEADQMLDLRYDGTYFQMLSPAANAPQQGLYTAYEAVTADDSVALLPVQNQHFDQLTDTAVNLGDSNVRRKRAFRLVPTKDWSLSDWKFRAAEAVNGATALGNLVISIQTESGGAPSGTLAHANATGTVSQATQRTWNTTIGTRTVAFAGTATGLAGVPIWIVYECSGTDSTNYLKFGANDSYAGHYLTFTSMVYNLDTTSWGSSSTTSIPFGWSNTAVNPFGFAICPTDADFAGRTWTHLGFAVSTVAAGAQTYVETDIATLASVVPDGRPYYISSTPGQITQTKPGNLYDGNAASYEIGHGISDTQLKIEHGEKLYFGRLTPTGSATTVHQLTPWFRPKFMEISGGYLSTANIADLTAKGIYDGTSNYNTGARITNGAAPVVDQAGSEQTTKSFGPQQSGAYWQGVGSGITPVGLTYTVTKTSTPADYNILYILKG